MNFIGLLVLNPYFFLALNDFICRLKLETNRYATRSLSESSTKNGYRNRFYSKKFCYSQ